MNQYRILTKQNNVMAVQLNTEDSEYEMVNAKELGFGAKEQLAAADKNQAVNLWIANHPAKRGLISRLNKWAYIVFHGLMLFWWLSYTVGVSELMNDSASGQYQDAANAGVVIGGAIGTSIIFAFWGIFGFIGAIILYITRPKPWNK